MAAVAVVGVMSACLCACGTQSQSAPDTKAAEDTKKSDIAQEPQKSDIAQESADDDYTDGLGDTFSGDTRFPEPEEAAEESETETEVTDVDLIFFMG